MARIQVILLLVTAHLAPHALSQPPTDWSVQGASSQSDLVGLHCQGKFPPHAEYLMRPEYNRYFHSPLLRSTYSNLLMLCARVDWGGAPSNVGAFCSPLTPEPDLVIFDRTDRPMTPISMDVRLALYCSKHCWCTGGRSGPISTLPREIPEHAPVNLQLFVLDTEGLATPVVENLVHADDRPSTPLEYIAWGMGTPVARYYYAISGPTRNQIICEGPVTPFVNHPYGPLVYGSLLQLCAAAQFGGSVRGNFGGFCHRPRVGGRDVLFSDEFAHPLAFEMSAMVIYCYAKCVCRHGSHVKIKQIFGGVLDLSGGQIILRSLDERRRPSLIVQTEPTEGGPVLLSLHRCALGPQNSCSPLPLDPKIDTCKSGACVFPPEHNKPKRAPLIININPSTGPGPLSGAAKTHQRPPARDRLPEISTAPTCSSSSTCKGPCGQACVCRVLDLAAAAVQQTGLDRVFDRVGCTLRSPATLALLSGIGKRATIQEIGDELAMLACACNSTYVSISCCDVEDGRVWEAPHLKLGRLFDEI